MKARPSVLTLAVADLERAVAFYRDALGWATEGIVGTEFEHGAVAFFELESGLRLAGRHAGEFSLGHNVSSRDEVDRVMDEAARAGAHVVKPAQPTFRGGYAGYFQDPDGHLWEVVFNPARAT